MTYFSSVIGHDTIKNHLLDLYNRKSLPHSLLFFGEPGIGKLSMAIALASTIVGRQVFSEDSGETYLAEVAKAREMNGETNKKIEMEGLPIYLDKQDVFWLRPVRASLTLDQWHQLVEVYLGRKSASPRVIIIEDFQTANKIMENAMLKTIEEPPENVYFIILTDKREAVIDTIVSRCMLISFQCVDNKVIKESLLNKGYTDNKQLQNALAAGQGNPSLVEAVLKEGDIITLRQAFSVLKSLATSKIFFTMVMLRTEKLSRVEMAEVFQWMRVLSRDMLALRYGVSQDLLQCPTYKEKLVTLLPYWSSKSLIQVGKKTLQAEQSLHLNIKTTLVMSGLLIALRRCMQEDRID